MDIVYTTFYVIPCQELFQLLWYETTRSNSKFAIAWVELLVRFWPTSICTMCLIFGFSNGGELKREAM